MTLDEMLSRISSKELSLWKQRYKREPFGDQWRQVATLCMVIAKANGLKKRGGGDFAPGDFYPFKLVKPPRQQSDEELHSLLGPIKASVKAKAKKEKKGK